MYNNEPYTYIKSPMEKKIYIMKLVLMKHFLYLICNCIILMILSYYDENILMYGYKIIIITYIVTKSIFTYFIMIMGVEFLLHLTYIIILMKCNKYNINI